MFNALGLSGAWAPGGFFFKSQSLNRKSNSYAFLSCLFLYKEETKGTGETNWPLWFTKHQFNKKDLTLKR